MEMRAMRRKDKEILDPAELEAILRSGRVCHLGMIAEGRPYVIPLSYGYAEGAVWIHGAREGLKWDCLRANPEVCLQVETDVETLADGDPCEYSVRYRSVVAFGTAEMLEDPEERLKGLRIVAEAFGAPGGRIPPRAAEATAVCRIRIDRMTGKRSGYPPVED